MKPNSIDADAGAKTALVSDDESVSEQRSSIMRAVRRKNTGPEMALRRALHARGIRYRLHVKELRGSPDLVFPKHRAVIFVHGCFWHRHEGCKYATTPSTRAQFWATKFRSNVERDARARATLRNAGWRVGIVWTCGLRNADSAAAAGACIEWLKSEEKSFEWPALV